MGFGLGELRAGPGPGKGVADAPDVDLRGWLVANRGLTRAGSAQ